MYPSFILSFYYDPSEYMGMTVVGGIISLVIWIPILIWIYNDAQNRGMNGVLWLIVVLVGGCIGCIVYLIVRQDHTSGSRSSTYYPPPQSSPRTPSQPKSYPPPQSTTMPPPSSFTTSEPPPQSKSRIYCSACNAQVEWDQKFCFNCGKQLKN